MSWYGIDAVDKAISRTRRALFEPFDFWKWVKLAIIIFFLGGSGSNFGGSGNNYRMNPEEFTNTTSLGPDLIPSTFHIILRIFILRAILLPFTGF